MVEGAVGVPGGGDSPTFSSSPSEDCISRVSSFVSVAAMRYIRLNLKNIKVNKHVLILNYLHHT